MSQCARHRHGTVELYFYDELDASARAEMTAHLQRCRECAAALEDLLVIRDVLARRPEVSAPPDGDWSAFMNRLNDAVGMGNGVRLGKVRRLQPVAQSAERFAAKRKTASVSFLLAAAALLAMVTTAVYFAARGRTASVAHPAPAVVGKVETPAPVATGGLKAVGEQHFERAKLVVLGLAAKEPAETRSDDWSYERELASSLLNDTRLYRLAAEERGYKSLAGVMRDLELVLLETAMAENGDRQTLGQIQRLIEKRALIEKMDTVTTAGM